MVTPARNYETCKEHTDSFHLAHLIASLESEGGYGEVYARSRPSKNAHWYRFFGPTRRWGTQLCNADMGKFGTLNSAEATQLLLSGLFTVCRTLESDQFYVKVQHLPPITGWSKLEIHSFESDSAPRALVIVAQEYAKIHCFNIAGHWKSIHPNDE